MYKVTNGKRTAKVDAPSMADAAAQFLKIPVQRLFRTEFESAVKAHKCTMFGVCTEDLIETDERVAVFEIEEE